MRDKLTLADYEFITKNPGVLGLDIKVFLKGIRNMYLKGEIELEDYAIALRKCKQGRLI